MRTLAGKHLGAVRSELAAADVPGTLRPSAAKWRGMCMKPVQLYFWIQHGQRAAGIYICEGCVRMQCCLSAEPSRKYMILWLGCHQPVSVDAPNPVPKLWLGGAGKFEDTAALLGLVAHTETDAWLALSLASFLNLLPLSRQLSCLSGSLWSRTLQARSRSAHCRMNVLDAVQETAKRQLCCLSGLL